MELFGVPGIFIFIFLVLIRPLTVFFHEMGHAVTVWLITRKKVHVFIGSYGDKDNSFPINFKDFSFYIFKNPLKWGRGLCESEEKRFSVNKQILYVFGGPAASLLLVLLSYFIISNTQFLTLFFIVLMVSSAIDFLINIFPSQKVVYMSDGRSISNDGKAIVNLIRQKKLPKEYTEGIYKFNEKKYSEAASIFDSLLQESKDLDIYRMAIISHINAKNFEKAKETAIIFKENNPSMTADDWTNFALTFTETGALAESLEYYDKALKMNPDNKFALNNKGYTLILLEKYEESIPLLNKAISVDKKFSYSYNNRGLAKINLDLYEEGRKDIEDSLQLGSENADAYKNLGIYYMKKMKYQEALDLFLKAKKMEETLRGIDTLITEIESKVEANHSLEV
ncbi:Tfp pilus assembly protein PilF [Chryseobacterium vietnamense]|uniref:Tfp pilus assembly protein PilF n=1 Tax=Chryseobacterium vietnamense TaxID=866785 RepID=A0ACC6J417_9FLAO|nr:M50 family metallopeptidase [Chryseobacterium vietnamense]MDR6457789.1 Tfp pilus assembly protein PilF [Chryseobacterium vietnamense]